MNQEETANAIMKAGVLLIESGAEIYRVEDTMNRLCLSRPGVSSPQSYVTDTGLMLSFEADGQVVTRIARVKKHKTNLMIVDEINTLSRNAKGMSSAQILARLAEIENGPKYPAWLVILMGGLGAGGFAIFFGGTFLDAVLSAVIGIAIQTLCHFMAETKINSLLITLLASFVGTFMSYGFGKLFPDAKASTLVISAIMLLAPGLAMTNAIRDTVSGDYLSGLAKGTEAILTATAIAAGSMLVLMLVRTIL